MNPHSSVTNPIIKAQLDLYREVYLDHAATTYLDPAVVRTMAPYWEEVYGNPSSLYRAGQLAKQALDDSRLSIARILNCQTVEMVLTSGGTESNNLAILGAIEALDLKGHLITSSIEHSSVLATFEALEQKGYSVTYLPVSKEGLVDPEVVRQAIKPDTLLVSIMYANNEIGTIQPIAEIGQICREKKVLFHTDACQASGYLPLDIEKLSVDLLSLNASKIYGPKGVGLLYIRQGTPLQSLLFGGGQEKGLRSGTENIPGIVGLAKALELVAQHQKSESARLTELRDYFIAEVIEKIPKISLNGDKKQRLANNINLLIEGVSGESLVLYLDQFGIAVATGSACDSSNERPSHVLRAIGLSKVQAGQSIRLSLGRKTTKEDLDFVIERLLLSISKLRSIKAI